MKRKLDENPFEDQNVQKRPKCPFCKQDGLFDFELPMSDQERINRESIERRIQAHQLGRNTDDLLDDEEFVRLTVNRPR